jgi:endonuclease/exonuclease/phosphatase family metal-dependent hydrolase
MRFRLVTYNIHKGIGGMDRRYRPERIIDTLAHYRPDIVLMQEVDDGVPRSRRDRQAKVFSAALELPHYAFQRNVRLTMGHYGNATLSRFPLSVMDNVNLTIPLKKRRRALLTRLHVRFKGHRRTMVIANVHLGLAGFERQMQLARLLATDALRHVHRHTPLIVGGDYNDVWGTLGRRIMQPAGFATAGLKIRTFPAALPVRALDHVFYRGDLVAHHTFASRSEISRQASDHLPLVVDFELLEETPHDGKA